MTSPQAFRQFQYLTSPEAVYPEEVITGHRAFIDRRRELRPSTEYRAPTDTEWEEFLGHFERRKVALGTCARAYGTGCIHEHSCLTEMILKRRLGSCALRRVRTVTGLDSGSCRPGVSTYRSTRMAGVG